MAYNDVKIVDPVSWGAVRVDSQTPLVQIDATTGLRTKTDVETFSATGGSASVAYTTNGYEFKCSSGTSVGGYGIIRSKRYGRYRAGQVMTLRLTARFPSEGVALGAVRAGGVTSGTELSFGYDGVNFGVLHRRGGLLEVQTLTISAAATGAETATITLAGTEFEVALTAGTAAHNAFEIASETFTGWNAYQNGSTVVFVATAVGTKTQDFTLTSTGTAAGTFAQTTAGAAVTDSWVYQSSWNIDKADGRGDLPLLDVSKGNIYQIDYQYLGYGNIVYSIVDPSDGQPKPVHRISYANSNSAPNLTLPSLKPSWFAASLGSTTNLEIYGGSAAAFTQGQVKSFRNPFGFANSKTSVGTSLTSILAIRVRPTINGALNITELTPIFASVAVEGTKPARVEIIVNPTFAGEPNWTYYDSTNSIAEYDTAGTTVTTNSNSFIIAEFALAKSGGETIDLKQLDIKIERTEVICIAVAATSGTVDATSSITWLED